MDLSRISTGRLTALPLEVRHEILARFMRGWRHARSEHTGFTACELDRLFAAPEKPSFKQAHDRSGVFFVEFSNPVVPGFPEVWLQGAVLLIVDAPGVIVRVDLEWHQPQRIKAWRLHDGHVVGGSHGGAGHVGSCTDAKVGDPIGQNSFLNRLDQAKLVQLFDEPESVAAPT